METISNSNFDWSNEFTLQEQLQNIIRHSNSLFFTHTPDGKLTYLSPQSIEILDCEPEAAFLCWQEFTTDHPENQTGVKRTELAILTGVKQPNYILQLRTKKDRLIWVEVDESPVVKNGKTVAIVGSLTEITQRRALEEKLKQNENKLNLVIDFSPIGIILRKPEGNLITYNKRFTDIFGIQKGEYTHVEELYALVYPENTYRKEVIDRWKIHIEEYFKGGPFRPFEAELVCNDGTVKTIEIGFGAIEDLYITTFVDITERKKILAEVERNKALLNDNENLSKTGAWDYNVKSKEIYWTDGLYAIHELEKNDSYDKFAESIKCYSGNDQEKVLNAFHECVEKGISYDLVFPFTTWKGNKKWIRQISRAIYDSGAVVKVVGTLMDITEQVKAEMKLKQLNATKDKLFGIVSHDLRNPIGAIISIAELALEIIDESNIDELKSFLNDINKSGKRSIDLLNNLLEWSSLNTGKITVEATDFELRPCVDEIEDLHMGQLSNKNIQLQNLIPDDFILYADKDLINTVLRNLVSNAIKFTPSNGSVKVQAYSANNKNIIAISDTGVGMKKELVNKIFKGDSFISNNGTNDEKGTGLGLMLCQEFVKLHKGDIQVTSEPGKGTTFEILLPKTGLV